jgi:hypothetical protein
MNFVAKRVKLTSQRSKEIVIRRSVDGVCRDVAAVQASEGRITPEMSAARIEPSA